MNTVDHIEAINMDHIRQQADTLDKQMLMSVRTEIFACLVLLTGVVLALVLGPAMNLAMQLSMAIMAFMSLYVPYRLISARRISEDDNWTLASRINREIEKLERQSALVDRVAAWYLAPLALAIFLGSWGGHVQQTQSWVPDTSLLLYWGAVVLLGTGILFYNRHNRRTRIQPVLDRLLNLRKELESDERST
ncbi:MAG: hypothetical protein AAF431_12755 [Pseudomonadota bacterium]